MWPPPKKTSSQIEQPGDAKLESISRPVCRIAKGTALRRPPTENRQKGGQTHFHEAAANVVCPLSDFLFRLVLEPVGEHARLRIRHPDTGTVKSHRKRIAAARLRFQQ